MGIRNEKIKKIKYDAEKKVNTVTTLLEKSIIRNSLIIMIKLRLIISEIGNAEKETLEKYSNRFNELHSAAYKFEGVIYIIEVHII